MSFTLEQSSLSLSSLSREYIKIKVAGYRGGLLIDPSAFTVEFGFTALASPPEEPDTWYPGDWETVLLHGTPVHYLARVLIGPGSDVVLADGTYDVWVKIYDTQERPVRHVGRIIIT